MALVERNGRPYRYRSIRRGGRVTSEYLGSGLMAALTVNMDEEDREKKAEARRVESGEREALAALERDLEELCEQARVLATEALKSAGYHQHARGQWRKRRGEQHREVSGR